MADAEAVLAALTTRHHCTWIGLVLNERGMHRAAATSAGEVNVVVVCTDTFSERNSGMRTADAVAMAGRVAKLAQDAGRSMTVTLAAAFGCPFEGEVPVGRVAELAAELAALGVHELDVQRRVQAVQAVLPAGVRLRAHFHNTRNTGYANALAAQAAGVTALDASLGGLGGCPFAPRATGNIATEDLVYALERSGIDTGMDLDALMRAAEWLGGLRGHLLSRAGAFPG